MMYDPRDDEEPWVCDESYEPDMLICHRCGEELVYDPINETYSCPTPWCLQKEQK